MKLHLCDPGPPLTPDDLKVFEFEIGGELPEDYKQFLLDNNGGWCEPRVRFDWHGEARELPYFDPLLPTQARGLRRSLQNLRQLECFGYLPIASDYNEQDVCVRFHSDVGRIYFSEYAYENYTKVGVAMSSLASSFTEFLEMLLVVEDTICPVETLGKHGTPAELQVFLSEGRSIDTLGKNQLSIICEAIRFGNLPIVEACLAQNANLSGTMHIAAYNNRSELVARLVAAGANVNEEDEFGKRPLHHVGGTALPGRVGARNREMRDTLIKYGATLTPF